MDLGGQVIKNLQSQPISSSLLHFVIDNWLWIHRNSFDQYNEQGEPFLSQFFLIEISTGRYIHRCQGQNIDQGSTLDLEALSEKLTQAFQGIKPCPGISNKTEDLLLTSNAILYNHPFPRPASTQCQFYYNVPQIKSKNEEDRTRSQYSGRCGPCQELWQELFAKDKLIETEPHNDNNSVMDVDYEVWNDDKDYLWDENSSKDLDDSHSSSNSVVKSNQSPSIPREYLCICCRIAFPTLFELSKHRNQKQPLTMGENDGSNLVNQKPLITMPESEADSDSSDKRELPKRRRQMRTLHKCSCCSEVFPSTKKLQKHKNDMLMINRSRRKVSCLDCEGSKIMSFKELLKHVAQTHPEKFDQHQQYLPESQDEKTMKEPVVCSICETVSNGRLLYLRHKSSYHTLGNHQCDTCQEPCLTYYDLMIHNFQKHGKSIDPIPINLNGITPIVDQQGIINYTMYNVSCPICLKPFGHQFACNRHMRKNHSRGKIRCKPCGEWSHCSKDISAHALLFHKDKPEVECPNCQKMFNLEEDPTIFDNHFPRCAPPAKKRKRSFSRMQCQFCGKDYAHKTTFVAHLKMHQGIIKHKCQYCDFGSNTRQVVKTHEKTHLRKMGLLQDLEEEQGRQCETCGKQLTNKNQLAKHIRIVHLRQKQTFQCKKCGEFFPYSAALGKHKIEVHGHVPKTLKK